MIPTSFPGSSLFSRKDPGNSWSRGSENIDCLRECGKSIILHASTSALYTSIARSDILSIYEQLGNLLSLCREIAGARDILQKFENLKKQHK
jgi:uncharacterized protein Yka (UPF0111/DUF47 family)